MTELRAEIEKEAKQEESRENLGTLLLSGPTFSKKQLDNVARTRKAINQWQKTSTCKA